MTVKLGSTGVRGRFYELTPELVVRLTEAFSTYIGAGEVAVARDTRPSGKFLIESVISGLMSSGANVHAFGICPTPILQWIIKQQPFNGGIVVTAAHNAYKWNSLIFLNADGAYLSPVEVEEFFSLYHSGKFTKMPFNRLGTFQNHPDGIDQYFTALSRGRPPKHSRFKFAIDCSNGAMGQVMIPFANTLAIDVVPLFCSNRSFFKKDPEPNISNSEVLATVVKETGCDGGFLLNSDATRILVVDEKGQPCSEELTLPLFASILLQEEASNIVTTYSTSKMVDLVAAKHGVKVHRTDVGPPSVVQTAVDLKAKIGGEGSGSILYTPFSFGYDSLYFIKKLVEYLDKEDIHLSTLTHQFKPPEIHKLTFQLPAQSIYAVLADIEKAYPSKIKLKDGLYIEDESGWMCIRASSTMSMIRIVAEGRGIQRQLKKIQRMIR